MGLNLTLCIGRTELKDIPLLGYDRIVITRDYDLYDNIKLIDSIELQEGLWSYEDEGIEFTENDAYGDKLKYVTAGELYKCLNEYECEGWNKGVESLLSQLPTNMKIVLYWD